MAGFKCPFCGQGMSLQKETVQQYRCNFEYIGIPESSALPHLEITMFRCPNDECQKEAVFIAGANGYMDDLFMSVYPPAKFIQFPDYVPRAILVDYKEACAIAGRSPKAAATLARRCLQGMIHDFWGIHEKNLNAEITQLKGKVPAAQWRAIDAVRSIGNIGAHMEHDVNLIVEVDTDEASKLIRLIEHLIEKWYIDRHETEKLYAELADISNEKSDARKR